MKPIHRVKLLIDYKKMPISVFEKETGMSNNSIQTALKRESNLKDETLNSILNSFPEISAEWLLTGKGEMLKSPIQEVTSSIIEEPAVAYGRDDTGKLQALEREIGFLKDIIKGNEGIISSKEDIINSKDDTINSKDDIINSKDDIILMLKKDNTRLEIENEHLRTKIEKWSPAEIKPTKEKNKTIKNQDNPLEKKTETNLELLNKPKLTQEPY